MCWTSGELVAYARSKVGGHVAVPRRPCEGSTVHRGRGLKDDPKGATEQSLDLELEKPPAAERVREAARNVNHTRRGAWQRWAVEEMRLAGLRRG